MRSSFNHENPQRRSRYHVATMNVFKQRILEICTVWGSLDSRCVNQERIVKFFKIVLFSSYLFFLYVSSAGTIQNNTFIHLINFCNEIMLI
jgi:hypothetical protein